MSLETINTIACGLIAFWATWCVLSGRVRDGVIGKLIYSAIAISGFVVTARNQSLFFGQATAVLTLHTTLALAGMRHMFMLTYWPRVKRWICRHLDCERCKPVE
ncbi:hypothetical protein N5K35_30085 [Pseudomonas sp. GD03651]|uniref:hypothetical protein n=1 Tax=Pseudomonas TaxID=286 RepID=UPI00034F0F9A|nr:MULTISPECIES: hypothetical protein [Pseudomonas]AGN82018.1 hypothetical protein L483_13145 [Pseudomonas putida H8234]MDH2187923.1 hypothetical protein [Pseudomonas sp. GD03651]HDS1813407.1 hypothetical protein [Pseudomonas putida]HDS3811162.1 hypothetical protein [Pseudomonas putida]